MKLNKTKINKAYLVCGDCGMKYGKRVRNATSTWHHDKCDICGKMYAVTEFRDFGYSKYL